MSSKSEHLKFIVGRFDHYYESINSKGSFYIALNSFLGGGLVAGYGYLTEKFNCTTPINFLLATIVLCGAISTLYTLYSINPFTKENANGSLIYFGAISNMGLEKFRKGIEQSTDRSIQADLESEAQELAVGLTGKFDRLQTAGRLIITQMILLFPLFILLVQNRK